MSNDDIDITKPIDDETITSEDPEFDPFEGLGRGWFVSTLPNPRPFGITVLGAASLIFALAFGIKGLRLFWDYLFQYAHYQFDHVQYLHPSDIGLDVALVYAGSFFVVAVVSGYGLLRRRDWMPYLLLAVLAAHGSAILVEVFWPSLLDGKVTYIILSRQLMQYSAAQQLFLNWCVLGYLMYSWEEFTSPG